MANMNDLLTYLDEVKLGLYTLQYNTLEASECEEVIDRLELYLLRVRVSVNNKRAFKALTDVDNFFYMLTKEGTQPESAYIVARAQLQAVITYLVA